MHGDFDRRIQRFERAWIVCLAGSVPDLKRCLYSLIHRLEIVRISLRKTSTRTTSSNVPPSAFKIASKWSKVSP